MDLNIKIKSSSEIKERTAIIRKLAELGWDSIAWNQTVLAKSSQRTHVKPKESIPLSTIEISEVMKQRCLINSAPFTEIKQYNRITLVVDDISDAQGITANNDHLRSFDIVAVLPGNQKVLAHICKNADVDLICFDFTRRIPFQINKKIVDAAIERGIQFEITYGPVYYSPVSRKEIIANSKYLLTILRRRNLILSSGTDEMANLRGRYEGINIGLIMQMSVEEARKATKDNCVKVLQHGIQRKNRFLPVEIMSIPRFAAEHRHHAHRSSHHQQDDEHIHFQEIFETKHNQRKSKVSRKRSRHDSEDEEDDDDDDNDHVEIHRKDDDVDEDAALPPLKKKLK